MLLFILLVWDADASGPPPTPVVVGGNHGLALPLDFFLSTSTE